VANPDTDETLLSMRGARHPRLRAADDDEDATQPATHLATIFFMLSGPSSSLSGKPWPCKWQRHGVVLSSAGPWCCKGV